MTEDVEGRGTRGAPEWLRRWRDEGLDRAAALARFDALAPVAPEEMVGAWDGAGLPTGHPLDGVLEALGWRGKRVDGKAEVHPLIFGPVESGASLDPGRLPVRLALAWPGLARSRAARAGLGVLGPVLRTRRPTARLACVSYRGVASAALVYDRQPIVDHFRRVDGERLVGVMEMRGVAPYAFLLVRSR